MSRYSAHSVDKPPPHMKKSTHIRQKKKNLHKNRGGEPEERKMATMDSKNRQQLIP